MYSFSESFEQSAYGKSDLPCVCVKKPASPADHGDTCPIKTAFDAWKAAGRALYTKIGGASDVTG